MVEIALATVVILVYINSRNWERQLKRYKNG